MKTVTGVIRKGEKFYIGECVEIDVITQGKTIDETIKNLKEAIALYFQDDRAEIFQLPDEPPITFSVDVNQYATR